VLATNNRQDWTIPQVWASNEKPNKLKERVEGTYAILARLLEEYGRLKDLFAKLEK
jgi:hypothetical protein